MTCRSDSANGWTYRFCPDDAPRAADRLRAIVRWVCVDEIGGDGPNLQYAIGTSAPGLTARISSDGIMGLTGNPARLYPGLATTPVDIAFTVSAPGYLPRSLQATLGPVAGFPDAFAPADAGTVLLHRQPFVLRGRVVKLGGLQPTPMAGVSVWLAGVWSTSPPANVDPATVMEPPNLVALQPGLYADRQASVDGLRRRDMTLTVGQDKTLLTPGVVGGTTVKLSDRVAVAVGTVLAFEPTLPARVEYVVVSAVVGASTADQPATVTLAHPLRMAHEEGTTCVVATPAAPGANVLLSRDGVAGEQVAFLATLGGVTAGVVELSGGGAGVEYQTVATYRTVSDGDGFYRLPPLSRVALVKLHADQAPAQEPVMSPDYTSYENLFDVIYP
jgi:hypothetical protein